MKLFKRLAAFVLCSCMLLSSCGAQPSGSSSSGGTPADSMTAKGRYVETDLTPEGGLGNVVGLFPQKDGGLILFVHEDGSEDGAGERLYQYTRTPDGKWEKEEPDWFTPAEGSISMAPYFQALTMGEDGSLYLVVNEGKPDWEKPVTDLHLKKIAPDKTVTEIPISDFETYRNQKNAQVSSIEVVKDGKLLLSYYFDMQGQLLYDNTGKQLGTFENVYSRNNAVLPDYFVQASMMGDELFLYKWENVKPFVSNDSEKGSFNFDENQGQFADEKLDMEGVRSGTLTGGIDGSIYSISREGIRRTAPGGSKTEVVMDGGGYSCGFPSYMIQNFKQGPNEDFYVLLGSQKGERKLVSYHYDSEAPAAVQKELVLFSLEESYTVSQAINEFQLRHPDVKINHQVGLDPDRLVTVDDVIRSLNTELLAGKGPDILILDGLPIDSYMEKGILLDLADKNIDTNSLLKPAAEAFAQNGRLYSIPGKIKVPMLVGGAEDLKNIGDLSSLVDAMEAGADPQTASGGEFVIGGSMSGGQVTFSDKSGEDKDNSGESEKKTPPLLSFGSPNDLIKAFYDASVPSLIKDGRLSAPDLREFLDQTGRMYKKLKPMWGDSAINGGSLSFSAITVSSSAGMYFGYSSSVSNFLMGNAKIGSDSFGNFSGLLSKNNEMEGNPTSVLLPGLSNSNYIPTVQVGINQKSSNQDLALEFLKTLLSEEVQEAEFGDGFPVNRQTFQKLWKDAQDLMKVQSDLDLLNIFDSLTTKVIEDATLLEVLTNEALAYFEGKKSLDDAVESITEQTKTYFAEKS